MKPTWQEGPAPTPAGVSAVSDGREHPTSKELLYYVNEQRYCLIWIRAKAPGKSAVWLSTGKMS
jgi:hypothetical protein